MTTTQPDNRATVLRAIRRALAGTPPAVSPNVLSFAPGVGAERAALLAVIEAHDAPGDPLVNRQTAILRGLVIDLANDLITHGRQTKRELGYSDDAAGAARLLRDEVIAALGSRADLVGPDSRP